MICCKRGKKPQPRDLGRGTLEPSSQARKWTKDYKERREACRPPVGLERPRRNEGTSGAGSLVHWRRWGAGNVGGLHREGSRLQGFQFCYFETVPEIGGDHGKEQVRVCAGIRDGRHLPAPLLGSGTAGWQEFPPVSERGSGPRGPPALPGKSDRGRWL